MNKRFIYRKDASIELQRIAECGRSSACDALDLNGKFARLLRSDEDTKSLTLSKEAVKAWEDG